MRRLLSSSRYLIIFAVLGSFVAAVLLLGYGVVYEVKTILALPAAEVSSTGLKSLVVGMIQIIDLFLLGTGFYLIALGFYELFIDDQLSLPPWLVIDNFDDLKTKLVSIVIVVLGVTFLSQAVRWDGDQNLLGYGIAIGLVIAALTYFISVKSRRHAGSEEQHSPEE